MVGHATALTPICCTYGQPKPRHTLMVLSSCAAVVLSCCVRPLFFLPLMAFATAPPTALPTLPPKIPISGSMIICRYGQTGKRVGAATCRHRFELVVWGLVWGQQGWDHNLIVIVFYHKVMIGYGSRGRQGYGSCHNLVMAAGKVRASVGKQSVPRAASDSVCSGWMRA